MKTYKTLLEEFLKESSDSENIYFNVSDEDIKYFFSYEDAKLIARQMYTNQLKIPLSFDVDQLMNVSFDDYRRVRTELSPIIKEHNEEIRKILEVANALILAESLKCKEDLEKTYKSLT